MFSLASALAFHYLCRMKTELKENGGLPAHILWTLAIVAGVSVANLYYNQPLLNVIRHELGVSEFKTNLIAMITQVGYAIGLLFIVPLGNLYQRKKIILTNFTLLIFSLIAIGAAPDIYIIWGASLITGICSMIPQIFVPIASQFSRPENKGRNVGIVISGLLTGILASRVVSGFVGEVLGCGRHDDAARHCRAENTAGHTAYIPGKVRRFDEIPVLPYQRLSVFAHLLHTRRHCIRLFPRDVVVPRIQNGTSPVLCRQ